MDEYNLSPLIDRLHPSIEDTSIVIFGAKHPELDKKGDLHGLAHRCIGIPPYKTRPLYL